jgi:allantoate deiminase
MKEVSYRAKAEEVMRRLECLAAASDEPGRLTRWFLSPAMKRANALAAGWMEAAGMQTREDGWGNVLGRWEKKGAGKVFLLGSHLDTVRDAGKYDGTLGVVLAIAAVELLREKKVELPFHLDVAGFSDEEGLRFQAAYLGSRALLGLIQPEDLQRTDADGVRLGDLVRPPGQLPASFYRAGELVGYLEAHIEQGPVLESLDRPLGIVSALAGQSRIRLVWEGKAGHAGTSPMAMRQDALAGAADFILAVEQAGWEEEGLVATVGQLTVEPGASNVIPGRVVLALDARHAEDAVRRAAVQKLEGEAQAIASARGLSCAWQVVQEHPAVACDPELAERCRKAAQRAGLPDPPVLVSGAGHDAAVLARLAPAAMLFVRSPGGISHHPEECVLEEDVALALEVLVEALCGMEGSA